MIKLDEDYEDLLEEDNESDTTPPNSTNVLSEGLVFKHGSEV